MSWRDLLKLFWIGLGILALDMASKGLISFFFRPFELSPHFFPFGGLSIFRAFGIDFCIHHVTNRGMAWGLGGGVQDLILMARLLIVMSLGVYLKRSPKAYFQRYALLLIIAGGLGNILDYFIYGHVIDMFHFIFWGYSYPVFNIADTSIFFGILALLWKSWKKSRLPPHVASESH